MKVHKILIPLIIALTLILIQGCAVDDRALEGSKEKSPQLAVNDEVITLTLKMKSLIPMKKLFQKR